MSALFASLQKVVPAHALSRLVGRLASSENELIKRAFIESFARIYDVNMSEAQRSDLGEYRSFNEFFTRPLKEGARPLSDGIVCPADGVVSQLGTIERGRLLQAKGHDYALTTLAGDLAEGLEGGNFCTIYLAPKDYHRVHLPWNGTLTATLAIPGELYSVNAATESSIPGLFARNERLVCRFDTEVGPMLVILVGAMIVASIATDWEGPVSPYQREEVNDYHLVYERGDEIGRFMLGSTVICCFSPGQVALNGHLQPGSSVRMGETMATPLNL